jgi:hypothetical protein
MSSKQNFSVYREILKNYPSKEKHATAIVPYIGMFMKDLTGLNEVGYHFQDDIDSTYNSANLFILQQLVKQFQTFQTNFYKFEINLELNQTFTSQLFNSDKL